MNKLLIILFVIFSLVFVPLAHAAGAGCMSNTGESACSVFQNKKQDVGKAFDANHCCCSPMAERTNTKHSVVLFMTFAAFILSGQINLTSLTIEPLLEPPSHA